MIQTLTVLFYCTTTRPTVLRTTTHYVVRTSTTKAEARPEALWIETEARPRHLAVCPRRGRDKALVRLEASRDRGVETRGYIPGG